MLPIITVLTPTYNRKDTIIRLYNSLLKQICDNFEWLIIDDGSTDGTDEYFNKLISTSLKIRYYKTKNGGKHRAINFGVDLAEGEYLFIVDSDDYLTDDSISIIFSWIKTIKDSDKRFAGVSGLKGYSPCNYVGKTFKGEYLDCSNLERAKFNIYGDKSEVYRTDILRKYKFPEITNEKFITEDIVWNRIANDGYIMRYFNKINYICEYRVDGLTSKSDKLFCENFEGYTLYIKELLNYEAPLKVKLKAIIAYSFRGRQVKTSYKILAKNTNIPIIILFSLSNLGKIYKKIKYLSYVRSNV